MNDLFEEFQEFRKILCICPCCGDLVRVSDLKLQVKGRTSRTWLDDFEKKQQAIENKESAFAEKEEALREIAREKGRKEADKVFNQAISPAFKALKLDPLDVKPLLNPVDFVVFDGMNKKESISNVIFLSKQHNAPALISVRKQIEQAILSKKYGWQVARIDDAGKITFE